VESSVRGSDELERGSDVDGKAAVPAVVDPVGPAVTVSVSSARAGAVEAELLAKEGLCDERVCGRLGARLGISAHCSLLGTLPK
jgi:hypothetical protein